MRVVIRSHRLLVYSGRNAKHGLTIEMGDTGPEKLNDELKAQLDAIKRETIPDRLMQLALELQQKLRTADPK